MVVVVLGLGAPQSCGPGIVIFHFNIELGTGQFLSRKAIREVPLKPTVSAVSFCSAHRVQGSGRWNTFHFKVFLRCTQLCLGWAVCPASWGHTEDSQDTH